jgi:hypothetical protein
LPGTYYRSAGLFRGEVLGAAGGGRVTSENPKREKGGSAFSEVCISLRIKEWVGSKTQILISQKEGGRVALFESNAQKGGGKSQFWL